MSNKPKNAINIVNYVETKAERAHNMLIKKVNKFDKRYGLSKHQGSKTNKTLRAMLRNE